MGRILALALIVATSAGVAPLAAQTFLTPGFSPLAGGSGPTRIRAADFDLDGHQDLVCLTFGSTVEVLLNDGSGGLVASSTLTAGPLPSGVDVGDLDGDGDVDIVVSNNSGASLSVFFNLGNGTFSAQMTVATVSFPRRVVLADVDGDNDLDIIVAAAPGQIRFNNGSGFFTGGAQALPVPGVVQDLAVGDLEGDGDQDIVLTTDVGFNDERLYRLRNNGSAGWSVSFDSLLPLGGTLLLADLLPGGELELAHSTPSLGGVQVWSLSSPGSPSVATLLATGTGTGPSAEAAGDLNGDGDADLVVSNSTAGTVAVFASAGGGTFAAAQTLAVGVPNPGGCALADFNGDGSLDLAVARPTQGDVALYLQGEVPDFRKPMISEFSWGNPDWVEITNHDTAARDLSGWTLRVRYGNSTEVATLSEVLAPGESLVVLEQTGTLPLLPGVQLNTTMPNLGATSGFATTVTLHEPGGAVVDEVRLSGSVSSPPSPGGGAFRGLVLMPLSSPGFGSAERIWGLDSNSAGDWTIQDVPSPGLENTSSGPRGTDPLPIQRVLITEVDDNPDLVEFVNVSDGPVDLNGWFLYCSAVQDGAHAIIRPWTAPTVVQDGEYFVIGESAAPPAEMPAGTLYVDVPQSIPWASREYDCALYDAQGRLVDLMRTTGNDDEVVHNHPRAPSHWADFVGAAPRLSLTGDNAIGRVGTTDDDDGGDWRAVFTRSMGSPNPSSSFAGPTGLAESFDYRINSGALGGGFFIIVNAGPQAAGYRQSIFPSYVRTGGQGPFFGIGADGLTNWVALNGFDPYGGTLDAQGAYRFDFPVGILPPGLTTDIIVILQDPTGQIVGRTKVIYYDA